MLVGAHEGVRIVTHTLRVISIYSVDRKVPVRRSPARSIEYSVPGDRVPVPKSSPKLFTTITYYYTRNVLVP